MTKTSAQIRKDDGKIVVKTDAYVSHRNTGLPWTSSYSLTVDEAETFIRQLLETVSDARGSGLENEAGEYGELALREHVRLVMSQDAVTEEEANVRAWLEGPKGYVERRHKGLAQ